MAPQRGTHHPCAGIQLATPCPRPLDSNAASDTPRQQCPVGPGEIFTQSSSDSCITGHRRMTAGKGRLQTCGVPEATVVAHDQEQKDRTRQGAGLGATASRQAGQAQYSSVRACDVWEPNIIPWQGEARRAEWWRILWGGVSSTGRVRGAQVKGGEGGGCGAHRSLQDSPPGQAPGMFPEEALLTPCTSPAAASQPLGGRPRGGRLPRGLEWNLLYPSEVAATLETTAWT